MDIRCWHTHRGKIALSCLPLCLACSVKLTVSVINEWLIALLAVSDRAASWAEHSHLPVPTETWCLISPRLAPSTISPPHSSGIRLLCTVRKHDPYVSSKEKAQFRWPQLINSPSGRSVSVNAFIYLFIYMRSSCESFRNLLLKSFLVDTQFLDI